MNRITPTNYQLLTIKTGRIFEDQGWTINDPTLSEPSLIRAIYKEKKILPLDESLGIYKFHNWLPINRFLKGSSAPVTFRSEKLGKQLGLNNLFLTFSGYWPEKGALMKTCSFKETEAYSVCGRMREDFGKILVVASAGNTARAFAQVCSDNNIPLLLCVSQDHINALWFKEPLNDCVKLICTPEGSDYFDAIHLSTIICKSPHFTEEGGAKNIARRDGMGTTVLSAATTIGRIPDSYFQAIGSATGTIAAWEANLRLIEDGSYGDHKMKLYPSQNYPYTPMYDAWKAGVRDMPILNESESRERASIIDAKVLSNRKPPYSIPGGLYDALKDTSGDIEISNNSELRKACAMFETLEGIDIHPAAGVAIASLEKFAQKGRVHSDDYIMLNITGGGEKYFKNENHNIFHLKPSLTISHGQDEDLTIKQVEKLF